MEAPKGSNHITERVMGTFGYIDLKYICTSHLTTSADVYSFGVVLLEMLSRHKPFNANENTEERFWLIL